METIESKADIPAEYVQRFLEIELVEHRASRRNLVNYLVLLGMEKWREMRTNQKLNMGE